MRTGKRWLAGIAAGGLAAGLISFTGSASAAPVQPVTSNAGVVNLSVMDDASYSAFRKDDPTYRETVGGAGAAFGIKGVSVADRSLDDSYIQVRYYASPQQYLANPYFGGEVLTDVFADPGTSTQGFSGFNQVILNGRSNGADDTLTFGTTAASGTEWYRIDDSSVSNANGNIRLDMGRLAPAGIYQVIIDDDTDTSTASLAGASILQFALTGAPTTMKWTPAVEPSYPNNDDSFSFTVLDGGGWSTYLLATETVSLSATSGIKSVVTSPAPTTFFNSANLTRANAWIRQPELPLTGGSVGNRVINVVTSLKVDPPAQGQQSVTATASGWNAPVQTALINVFTPNIGSVAWPAASRAQQTQALSVSGFFPKDGPAPTPKHEYDFCTVPGTNPGVWQSFGDQTVATANDDTRTVTLEMQAGAGGRTSAGTYTIALYYRADDTTQTPNSVCYPAGEPLAGQPRPNSIALTPGQQLTFGGPISTITQTPANLTVAPTSTQEVLVQAFDVAGRRTLPLIPPISGMDDKLAYSSANTAIATVLPAAPNATQINTGVLGYEVTGVAPGNTTVRTTSTTGNVAAAVSQVGVASPGSTTAATTIGLSQPNVVEVTGAFGPGSGSLPADRRFLANLTVTSFTFNVTGLQAGQTYAWAAEGDGVTLGSYSGTVTASATGTASQVINVIGGVPLDGETIKFGIPAIGIPGGLERQIKMATVTYASPETDFYAPEQGQTYFAAANATVPVSILAATQYGAPAGGSSITIQNAAGTVVASGVTNAQGQLSLNVTAPASGFTSFTMRGQTATGTPISPNLTFWVNTNTPTVTIPSGVSIPGATVTREVPYSGTVRSSAVPADPTFEATEVLVRVNATGGADITEVTVSGGEGVWFFDEDPNDTPVTGSQPWNAGDDTITVVTEGGVANVWAYATKSGLATITASVGGQSASGNFTVVTPGPAAARNLKVEAPASITTSELGVLTMSLTDAFGNAVNASGMQVRLKDGSIGTFANGLRQTTVDFTGEGRAQVTVSAGQEGKIEVIAGTVGFGQFGNAANVPGAAFTASNAPAEASINVTVAKGLLITNSGRDSRGGYFSGVASGFAAGETVNVRYKVYNNSTKKWSAWKAGGTVTLSTVVDSAGNRSFSGVVEKGNALKVRVTKSGVNSEVVTIPAR